ncbi:uncharacterized protein LOC112589448 isoform X2 [Harpegnathos saltator]|uniref:uncharacterized protein LOC112589448 isoform X2 n=1 Tax=Harpegnathos saltator TaxID=610380 RepID=UPI000DBEF24E|nr:uncharacterized protein LOC112589448 isoform X2 [Harpegnathos saltator]
MEQSEELSISFKVNNDMLSLKLLSSETELYNKIMNDDTYSIQYIKLMIKNGLCVLHGSENQKIEEISRVIEDEIKVLQNSNVHNRKKIKKKIKGKSEDLCNEL